MPDLLPVGIGPYPCGIANDGRGRRRRPLLTLPPEPLPMTRLRHPRRLTALAMLLLAAGGGMSTWLPTENLGAAGPRVRAGYVDQARLDGAAREPQNWMSHGGTYEEQRFSALDQVNEGDV